MRRKLFLAVALCLLCLSAANAQVFLKVNETETKAVYENNQLLTSLALENSAAAMPARVRLEVLDALDNVVAASESTQKLARGVQKLSIPIAFSAPADADDLLWKRLRYAIATDAGAGVSNIVSLSEIMPEVFELQISAPERIYAGMNLRAHVVALHPFTRKPIKSVALDGELKLELDTDSDDDTIIVKANGKTNDEGFASLDFKIPSGAKLGDDGRLTIKGGKNGILREAREYLDYEPQAFIYLNTDKPIYQPSQKLFVRGLYLDARRRPLANRELSFEISGEDDETVYEGTLRTSRFGVANIEWQIPADFKLGKYRIEVESDDEDHVGLAEFKVSRYDLPNFTVAAKTAKPFYLPNETKAEVSVSAAYLFGRPVERGRVRVVEEKERRSNDSEDETSKDAARAEGETDASGNFTAQIDLAAAQKELSEDNWKRFADVKFTAYFTDPTTGRTEQKHFDVRLTKESIHVYFIRQTDDPNPRLPFSFYISTFYADGTPARCDVKIEANYRKTNLVTKIAEARTNAYGAGKFEVRLPEKPFPEAENELNFRVTASDGKGARGTLEDNLYANETLRQLRVRTDKTIYLPNEPVNLKIFSTESEHHVFVDVLKNGSVVYSKNVRVSDARASLTIPARPDFTGELTIAAYYRDADNDNAVALKTILYPQATTFNVDLKSLKKVYRPNEDARVSFAVAGGEEKTREAALGVLVLDKAIEERARTEDLPDNFAMLRELVGTADSFGNLTRRDLDRLDLAQPVTEDLQLAAEFLLAGKRFEPNFFWSDSFEDDFRQIYKDYFDKKLANVEKILLDNYEKTGEVPKDENALRRILSAGGVDFGALRDAWEMPLETRFSADRANAVLTFLTSGADKRLGTGDDFAVKEMRFEWFGKTQNELNVILNNYRQQTENVPRTAEELKSIWRAAGIDFDALRDGWNRPLYIERIEYDRDFLKITPETVGNLDGERQLVMSEKMVAQKVLLFKVRSAGADGVRGVYDDFDLAAFTIVLEEKSLSPEKQTTVVSKSPIASAKGAIAGTISDSVGAVVPGATVKAINQNSKEVFTIRSNDEGRFLFANLPSGKYEVTAESSGFQSYVIKNIVVSSMNLVRIEVRLEVGTVNSIVDVTSDTAVTIDASASKINTTRSESKSIAANFASNKNAPVATPRVREYFPETLLWQPELLTDKAGRAELKFKLGDNLTTWKMYAFASNEAGEVALAEKEFQTFQPFFAELDPPRILTEGDRIALAVPVRNYTDRRQKVAVSLAPNDWSRLAAGGAEQSIEIAPNASQNAVFNLQAVAPVADARQKVTALAARGEADAIEKKVSVRPNGKENVQTQSVLFDQETAFDIDFPANAFPKTRSAEIKIYPNMLAHVAESVEGLLKRPYGCGEQTTSSTYPNLMILRIEKDLQKNIEPRIKAQALIYLEDGYDRLLNYQTDAGFGYWNGGNPDTALTAYVLRFLADAAGFIEVDAARVERAEKWLLSRQNPNGGWENNDVLTAYVLRSLTLSGTGDEAKRKSVAAGIDYLNQRLPEIQDSYVLANFAMAAQKTGDAAAAQNALDKLRSLGQAEKESLFWTTSSTPFHGWGTTAKIETTALVVQAFLGVKGDNDEQISRGLSFLLKNKDKHGVWYSTQTTVNALDALILLQKTRLAGEKSRNEKGEIFVNGKKAQEFSIDSAGLKNPLVFDISPFLTADKNRVEIKTSGELNLTMAQAVAKHYVNWNEAPANTRYFDLKVEFDKTQAKIGEEISCRVRAQRQFNRGGMAVAEIGLPPGADVDRAALEQAKKANRFSSYDVLPDKIVIYFWASSNSLDVEFKFRPRFGLDAQTAPFTVYDYYNEEASATLAPVRFDVK